MRRDWERAVENGRYEERVRVRHLVNYFGWKPEKIAESYNIPIERVREHLHVPEARGIDFSGLENGCAKAESFLWAIIKVVVLVLGCLLLAAVMGLLLILSPPVIPPGIHGLLAIIATVLIFMAIFGIKVAK